MQTQQWVDVSDKISGLRVTYYDKAIIIVMNQTEWMSLTYLDK